MNEGPVQVSRERISRRIVVECNVRGRDIGSFVAEAQQKLAASAALPPGYFYEWGGQFQNLEAARGRLLVTVPVALLSIFLMLFMTFHAATPALLIYLNVPMAATGGICALALRGMPLSISAAIGFIALFGVAVLNGVVLMTHVLELRRQGLGATEAARRRDSSAAGVDDRPGGEPRVHSDGDLDVARGRGSAPAGDGRHRRPGYLHGTHPARAARSLRMDRGEEGPGEGRDTLSLGTRVMTHRLRVRFLDLAEHGRRRRRANGGTEGNEHHLARR